MPPDKIQNGPSLDKVVNKLAAAMLRLDSGDLARLRRMKTDGPGEPAFWKLAVESGLRTDDKGFQLVQTMALLAPKSDPGQRRSFHDYGRPLGTALARVGYSELRLARFLELPHESRADALGRMARWLVAGNIVPVNCLDIACLLFSSDARHARRLARDYYKQLDHVEEKESAA